MKDKILKTSVFRRWAKKADLTDQALVKAVYEIKEGLVDADLGSGLIKKSGGSFYLAFQKTKKLI